MSNVYNVVLFAAAILGVIFFYFINSIMRQHKKVLKWQQARIAAEISILENERKRIAGDLHDELGPMLSGVKLQINHLEPVNKEEAAVLEKSCSQIDDIVQRFREISYDLLPNTLVRKGFIKATTEFIGKLKLLHPLKIEFTSVDFSLDANREVSLYRMIQEIIQNTLKHAKAQVLTICISVSVKDKAILVQTKDDGIGFNYNEKNQQANGVGLLSLQSRAELLGGQLIVNTQPGSGTLFEIEIPL